ncbi:MAG: protein-disulfide reductase DsbD family protein [Vicinamibacterales bacterium]|nr:protein-disulfide reductase DsbD family protein [Vicinamibacterales bacterium]
MSPGTRFAVAARIVPRKGIHIYAPGAEGYRIVSLRIDPQPFVRLLPMQFPPSEIYHFEPLDEHVPVYQTPFTLLQEVVLEVTGEAERALRTSKTLTLTGTLEYQACDDKICFNPVSMPLSWTLALVAH